MSHFSFWILLIVGSALIISTSGTPTTVIGEGELPILTSSMEAEEKPIRPRLFQSPEQIRTYLDTLGKYYFYNNRSRFGKRTVLIPLIKPRANYDSKPSEEYDTGNIH